MLLEDSCFANQLQFSDPSDKETCGLASYMQTDTSPWIHLVGNY